MSTMKMPGFTGEASVYKASGHYRLSTRSAGRADVHLGLAQFALPLPLLNGGGEICIPGIGKCVLDPDSPTGCSILHRLKTCEEFTVPCTCPPMSAHM